jgi:hypothetical protein
MRSSHRKPCFNDPEHHKSISSLASVISSPSTKSHRCEVVLLASQRIASTKSFNCFHLPHGLSTHRFPPYSLHSLSCRGQSPCHHRFIARQLFPLSRQRPPNHPHHPHLIHTFQSITPLNNDGPPTDFGSLKSDGKCIAPSPFGP